MEEEVMKAKKLDHPNGGIKCKVNSCLYYMSGDQCCAERIEVAPENAHSVSETGCQTFQNK